jgi:heme/copper-type cytochrome/quinol oxidase subunit 2
MKTRLFRIVAIVLLAVFLVGGSFAETAEACPMCKAANEENNAQAKAYMYSILFMLAVPGMIFGGLTAGLIRLGYKEARAMKEYELDEPQTSEKPQAELASQELTDV